MDRTPLKSLGNILPNCLTLSGHKKLSNVVNLTSPQLIKPEFPAGSNLVVKPTLTHGPTPSTSMGQENTSGKRSRHESETERWSGSPGTPIKPSDQPGTPPLTPLANLKVLIAAASTALENEALQGVETGEEPGKPKEVVKDEDGGGRKMKSLAILCKRFLAIAETEIGVGNDFSLESMSKKLGTNRRRIYDIINVLEALEMIVKQSKNWYTWLGQGNLLVTLAKMKAMAEDDVDFRAILNKENVAESGKDTPTNRTIPSISDTPISRSQPSISDTPISQTLPSVSDSLASSLSPTELSPAQSSTFVDVPVLPCVSGVEEPEVKVCGGVAAASKPQEELFGLVGAEENGGVLSGGRWDKSLGVLCQKFVMLFLVTPENEVTLDYSGNVLMPDDTSFPPIPLTNPKTKVRRLYDIANVLTTLGLIRKKTFLAPNHRKMPGYSWAGPSLEEIKTISVFRKSESNLYPFYSKRQGARGTALTRKPSFGAVRPFLHQYEVKGETSIKPINNSGSKISDKSPAQPNSAPSSPAKSKESGFKRSLSFGAGVAKKQQMPKVTSSKSSPALAKLVSGQKVAMPTQMDVTPVASTSVATSAVSKGEKSTATTAKCVLARQLPQQQVDYLQEVVEFETELLKHSHKYPHIAPIFHDFVVRFHNTLRQAAVIKTSEQASVSQPIIGITAGNLSTSMPTTYADIMSPPSGPCNGNATPSAENILNAVNFDHAFNPNSLLVTSPTPYPFIPTTSASSPSFFPFYPSSLSPVAMMAAALSRTTGSNPNTIRSLAPKPSVAPGDSGISRSDGPGNPAKKAKLDSSS